MRQFKIYLLLLSTGVLLMLGSSCGMKKKSWSRESVIAVMADTTDWLAMQGMIKGCYERVVRTPQMEKTYTLKYVSQDEFIRYSEYKSLLLIATLSSTGRVGDIVNKLVSDPEIRASVVQKTQNIFLQSNPWAKGQTMAVLVAGDYNSLSEVIDSNRDFLYGIFDVESKEKIKSDMYYKGEKKEIGERLMSTYGWSLRVQHDYFVAEELPGDGMIWFRRMYPERWLFVRWIDGVDSTLLNSQWVLGERNRVGGRNYGGDRISDEYLFSYRSKFLGRDALITSGLWENNYKVAGGPFKNYTFYDPLSKRVYMIDIAVFAPGREKLPFLRRMDIMAHTFRTIFDQEEQ